MTKRAIASCDACRQRKVRCSKDFPNCANCKLRGCECSWNDQEEFERFDRERPDVKRKRKASTSPSSPEPLTPTFVPMFQEPVEPEHEDLEGVISVFGLALGLPPSEVAGIRTLSQARTLLSRRYSSNSATSSSSVSSIDSPPGTYFVAEPPRHTDVGFSYLPPQIAVPDEIPIVPSLEQFAYTPFEAYAPVAPLMFESRSKMDMQLSSYGHQRTGELNMGWAETDPLSYLQLG